MIIFSVFVANVANLINVDLTFATNVYKNQYRNVWKEKNRTISDSMDHLVWFLQVMNFKYFYCLLVNLLMKMSSLNASARSVLLITHV